MLKYQNPLFDDEFLKQLSSEHEREIYAKIIALDLNENPIEEIQGRVTQGSVPVDGNSLVRRTCSLTMVAHELNINDYIWGLETKVKLYIGLKNKINPIYPPIIWFKMGTFVLTSFNNSISSSGHTVSLQGKDKMCLLNGDVGGNLTALSYDFGKVTVINKSGYSYTEQLPLKKIISKAVHDYAKEPYHNIIINDLDDCGLELLEYRGDDPLYFVYNANTQEVSNMVLNQTQSYYVKEIDENENEKMVEYTIEEMEIANKEKEAMSQDLTYVWKLLTDDLSLTQEIPPTQFFGYEPTTNTYVGPYNLIKIEKGMTCGYRTCDLVYAGNLTSNAGEPITGMLTKIVNMLGNYEYFYNLDGQFVFQRKRTYVNTSWNNMVNNGEEDWVENAAYTASYLFSFEDGNLITSYQNAPNLANLKNDFSIWGTRTGVAGTAIPIHLRYAIDNKPRYYTNLDGITYTTRTEEEVEWDRKNFEYDIAKGGYQKEPSRFGLSEDWWEVRDWAKAWEFSGLQTPTEWLGKYCPIRSCIIPEGVEPPASNDSNEVTFVNPEALKQWGIPDGVKSFVDDLIFTKDGAYWGTHGGCAHSYTEWLNYFAEGGRYEGGYAYFYKPRVPADELGEGGQGLILGDQIKYALDWRELIYQMALDYNKHGDEDDFLMNVRDKNPSFYPTGYTGYEQYYIDIEGFWRQLYDPDYKTSYDIVSISKRQFEEEGRLGEYFYDAPIYTQCKVDDPFFGGVLYYIKKDSEYEAATGLMQADYGKNPTLYYRIEDTEIQPVPLMTEPYSYEANSYYTRTATGFVPATNVTPTSYAERAISLYLRVAERSYFPCLTIKPFVAGKMYFSQYKKEGEQEWSYKPETTVKEDVYLKSPGKYFERAIVGGQIIFSNCTTIQTFDPQREYYIKQTNGTYTKATLTKEDYDAKGFENEYYYAVINYSYIPCIHPKYPYDPTCNYYVEGIKEYYLEGPNLYWNKKVHDSPESLNFWFDFLDTYGELSEYSVSSIGDRPKAVNDNNVKAIYFRETPGVIFVENLKELNEKKSGYTYAQLPKHLEYLFSISGQGKSAKDVLDGFLYTHSYCTESITLNAIPVYYLEPNTRIFVRDDKSGINGEYIVTRLNYPLAESGTMSINATKVVDRIY